MNRACFFNTHTHERSLHFRVSVSGCESRSILNSIPPSNPGGCHPVRRASGISTALLAVVPTLPTLMQKVPTKSAGSRSGGKGERMREGRGQLTSAMVKVGSGPSANLRGSAGKSGTSALTPLSSLHIFGPSSASTVLGATRPRRRSAFGGIFQPSWRRKGRSS